MDHVGPCQSWYAWQLRIGCFPQPQCHSRYSSPFPSPLRHVFPPSSRTSLIRQPPTVAGWARHRRRRRPPSRSFISYVIIRSFLNLFLLFSFHAFDACIARTSFRFFAWYVYVLYFWMTLWITQTGTWKWFWRLSQISFTEIAGFMHARICMNSFWLIIYSTFTLHARSTTGTAYSCTVLVGQRAKSWGYRYSCT